MEQDCWIANFSGRWSFPTLTILRTDWGDVQLPDSANRAYLDAPKNRWGLPDERTRLGKRLKAYERRQLKLANEAMGDFAPEEFV